MIPFKETEHHICVKTPFEDREFATKYLNGTWSRKENMNRFPKNYHTAVELITRYPLLQYSPGFMEMGARLRQSRLDDLQMKGLEDVSGDPRLRPYQRVDVEYLKSKKAAGIFNQQRTGKTPTTIVLFKELETLYNLIVCPASLVDNWAEEFGNWYPECDVFVYRGTLKKRQQLHGKFTEPADKPRVLIVGKETWRSDWANWLRFTFDAVAIDEAHFLRNRGTAQTEAITQINANRRYALTGTPAVKHDSDMFGIFEFLFPEEFTSFWQWGERYWHIPTLAFSDAKKDWSALPTADLKTHRRNEFLELVGLRSVQRKRSEVMAWLPDKQRQVISLNMEGKQRKVYDEMLNDFMLYDSIEGDDAVVDAMNVLAQLTRLRQLCLDPQLLAVDAPSAKTKALLSWLEDNPEPVVIMSKFTSYLGLVKPQIEKLGLRTGVIAGVGALGCTRESIKRDKELFQSGQLDVLLCNIESAGTGHTLDRAETVIFTDLDWTPALNEQAEDRIIPVDESRNHSVTVITFEVKDSVDERVNEILRQKIRLTDAVNNASRDYVRRLALGE